MNFILLIFILLAAMFIASSTNNMLTVSTALDSYLEKANVPDYWFAISHGKEMERFERFAKEHNYRYNKTKLIQLDPNNITVSGKAFEYDNSTCISAIGGTKVFDKNAQEITHVNDGEIYITASMFQSEENDFYEGCKIELASGELKKEFTLKGYTKDALFGSNMIGMTRFLVSENDLAYFDTENANSIYSLAIYTDNASFMEQFNSLNLMTTMNADYSVVKRMYIMDMLIAAVLLVVSVCLILISMVILRFTIHFTVNEEFREIGVAFLFTIS